MLQLRPRAPRPRPSGRSSTEFLERFPGTVELTIAAMIIAVGVGIPLGYLAARRRGRLAGPRCRSVGSLIGVAIPVFFLALPAQVRLRGEAAAGSRPRGRQDPTIDATHITNFFVLDGLLTREWDAAWDALWHLVLPGDRAGHASRWRSSSGSPGPRVLDVLNEDYVRTAEAKGLTDRDDPPPARAAQRAAAGGHHDRPAAGGLLSGAVLTETVFAFSGIGAVRRRRDQPARLSRAAGLHPVHRGGVRAGQPARRPLLRRHRPEGEGAMTTSDDRQEARRRSTGSPSWPPGTTSGASASGRRRSAGCAATRSRSSARSILVLFVLVAIFGAAPRRRTTRDDQIVHRRGLTARHHPRARRPSTGSASTTSGRDVFTRMIVRRPADPAGRRRRHPDRPGRRRADRRRRRCRGRLGGRSAAGSTPS